MTLVLYKVIAAALIFAVSIATIIYPLKKKSALKQHESMELGEALASGIFLGAAFFHMLPEAIHLFNHVYGALAYPIPEAVCVLGFLLMLFLERLSLAKTNSATHFIPYTLAAILVIHAIVEGTALGIGTTLSASLMIFIAILAHKGSESFALCMALLRHALPFKRIIWIIIFFSLMTPIGIALGATINYLAFARNGELVAACFNAFAAGTFLYISTLHHIHFHRHANNEAQGMLEFACLAVGAASMAVIALYT